MLGKEFRLRFSPGVFISDLPLISDGFQFGEERKFREGEVVLFEILAVFVAGDFADEGKIVAGGCGEHESVFKIG